ncbi:protoporphyrinogen oxidase [Rhodoluna lacicola]|nr:protoporphyrinogen oxidase [Rhodoluna lacicola]
MPLTASEINSGSNSKSAAVVGAGIAGLVAAKRLVDSSFQVDVFESTDRVGGLISAAQLGNYLIDIGAESFAVAKNTVPELCAELGIENLIVQPQRSDACILGVRGVHTIPHGVLGIPSDLDAPEVAEAVGIEAVALAKQLDSKPWVADADISIGDLVEVRLGKAFVDNFLTPVIAGVHSSDPQKLEVATVSPSLLAKGSETGSLVAAVKAIRSSAARPGAAVASISGGMHKLVTELESYLINAGVVIHLNKKIESLADLASYDRVVLAAGIEGAAQVMADNSNDLAKDLQQDLASFKGVDAAVVALLVESEQLNEFPRGSGVLVSAEVSDLGAKAATHVNAKWAWVNNLLPKNQHILRFSFGRNGVLPAEVESLAELATRDAARIFGISDVRVIETFTKKWPHALVQATPGHSAIVKRVKSRIDADSRLTIIGAGLGGNGIAGILSEER